MAVTRKTRPKQKPTLARPASWQSAVRLHFAKIPEVDAVFVTADNKVVHVFSVVHDFDESIYGRLLKKERRIEKEFPEVECEFHLRAHQGRKPHLAAPFGAEAVFER